MHNNNNSGFTLIEVLIALVILAIALIALLNTTTMQIAQTKHIKNKNIAHWVMLQGIYFIQLGLIQNKPELTHSTQLFGEKWYWRAQITSTPIANMQRIIIKAANKPEGPFIESFLAYKLDSVVF